MYLRIASEGYIFVLLFLLIGCLAFFFSKTLAIAFLAAALFSAFFFRDPPRVSPAGRGLILSPADGEVVEIADVVEGDYLRGPAKRVSIFLSIFNVHINYAPIEGAVRYLKYNKGQFKFAFVDKASELNENNAMGIESRSARVYVKQIAGMVARRIVCRPKLGDTLKAGEKFGLIRFGSRVDIFVDQAARIVVNKGDKVTGGVTVIGELKELR